MSDNPKDHSGNPSPSGDLLPAERSEVETWEVVLGRASEQSAAEAPRPAPTKGRSVNWSVWARAAVPLIILVVYAVYKLSGIERVQGPPPEITADGSLSGVQAAPDRIRIDRETEEFLLRLDRMFQVRDWNGIVAAIIDAPEQVRGHPVVQAFNAIARVFQGDVSGEIRMKIRALLPSFERDKSRQALYDYLLLADATMELRATGSPEEAIRGADYFRQSLRKMTTLTQDVVSFRTRLAERYERMADTRMDEAGGFRADKTKISEARSLYQHSLRWVSSQEGWLQLQPISAGEPATVRDRVVVKLKKANQKFHGFMIPVKSNDNSSWTSRAGDPVHDRPGGTW